MATAALSTSEGDSGKTLQSPWGLVRRIRVTSGTAAGTLAHGGPASVPDMFWAVSLGSNPDESRYSIQAVSTTTFTIDFSVDSIEFYVFLVWNAAAAGGITS